MKSKDVFDKPRQWSGQWSNEQLDALRQVTDDDADAVIEEYFSGLHADMLGSGPLHPHALLTTLMNERIDRSASTLSAGQPISDHLIARLAERSPPPEVPDEAVREGQELFQNYGPEMLMNLCCFSLPQAYGAAKGARVLHLTGYLENRVQRRLIETTQMVIDVMKPGGLRPEGDGIRTAREVRLMHAAIRHLIRTQADDWDTRELGKPINQEDMAGTLMTFSYVVLKGLHTLGIEVDRESQEAYLTAWRFVGQSMGLVDELLPKNLEEAQQLTWLIYERQLRGSPEGRALMKALLDTMRSNLPGFARWFASSSIRVLVLKELADKLGVPRNLFFDTLTYLILRTYAMINNFLNIDWLGINPHRWFSHLVIDIATYAGRGHDRRATFRIPDELREYWDKPPPRKRR